MAHTSAAEMRFRVMGPLMTRLTGGSTTVAEKGGSLVTWVIVVVAVVVVIALAALALGWSRSAALRRRFGPEYDRTVDEEGGRRAAEASLRDRAKRRDELEIRELSSEARLQFAAQWRDVQSGFVDDPHRAVDDADRLVQQVMRERGYPVDEFDERLEMVTVDHPELAENYRVTHSIQRRGGTDGAPVDDLREAFWSEIQTGFVDEPGHAVQSAGELLTELIDELNRRLTTELVDLDARRGASDDVSTEDLRVTFQRYRTFFDRLMAV